MAVSGRPPERVNEATDTRIMTATAILIAACENPHAEARCNRPRAELDRRAVLTPATRRS